MKCTGQHYSLCKRAQAQLADRDFRADRGEVIVVSTGAVAPKDHARTLKERHEAERRHEHRSALQGLIPKQQDCLTEVDEQSCSAPKFEPLAGSVGNSTSIVSAL